MIAYRVELVYSNYETDQELNFYNEDVARCYFDQIVDESINEGYEYATMYSVMGDVDDIDELDITNICNTIDCHTF